MPRAAYLAGPLALLVTGSAVAAGVVASDPATSAPSAAIATRDAATSPASSALLKGRREVVSRAESRQDAAELQRAFDANAARIATLRAIKNADTRRWTTAPLYLWTAPGKDAKKVGLIDDVEHVLVTGRRAAGRVELVINRKARWVTAGYLADKKPLPPPPPP